MPPPRLRVALAGASGFVGRHLVRALAGAHDVVALTRSPGRFDVPGAEARACDLFSLRDAERGLEGADAAYYLVHSMMPSARLTQGRFDDLDLVCADNFGRAARAAGVRHVIYLGGLLPPRQERGAQELSRHLESRLEVEKTLGAYGVPVTTLRAGLVVGAGGSSFELMTRLVERLPVMVGPRWMRSRSQAIGLDDVVTLLEYALAHPELAGRAYDVGCPDVHTYEGTLRLVADVLGRRPRIVTLPVRTARLSLLWVSVVAGAPRSLVAPLLESLQHDLVAQDGLELQRRAGIDALPLRKALERAVAERERLAREAKAPKKATEKAQAQDAEPLERTEPAVVLHRSRVRSVQRLPLPPGRDARWVAAEYARWLPQFMRPFLRVDVDAEGTCRFYLWPLRAPLLVLTFVKDRSHDDRQLYYVTGGVLARVVERGRARLEFRSVLGGRFVLAAIHDFVPRLPWFVYSATQAVVHLFVMQSFGRHLARVARGAPSSGHAASDPA